jgi:arginase
MRIAPIVPRHSASHPAGARDDPRGIVRPMGDRIVVVGSPTALGGHFGGMERTPGVLRDHGLLDRAAERPRLASATWSDHGDVPNDPGWVADPDPRAKNRALLTAYLPRLAAHVARSLADGDEGSPNGTRLLVLGGDCTSHPGAMAGLRRARRGLRLGLAWFDAHGDFNTPDSTPSGNVWGMPFAMACGRGDTDLVGAVDGPSVREADAALFGGQVLDETESRMLAAASVAQFGAGMLADPAGQAAVRAWAGTVARRIDGWYIAFDLDALDASGDWSVAMPEADGLELDVAVRTVAAIASAGAPVMGFGASAAMEGTGDMRGTVDAIAQLTEAALGR